MNRLSLSILFVLYTFTTKTKKKKINTIISHLQGGAKVTLPKKKLNISIMARADELIFLSMIETRLRFISIKTCLDRALVKYHY